jgi:enoyl-CoA hydratase/carnithine racemase
MSFTSIEVATSHHLTQITINRPQARNALTIETLQELTRAFQSIATSSDVRCVLLTGAGTEAFCAGADLNRLLDAPAPEERRAFFDSVATVIEAIRSCPVPVVAAVHGFALAGGCGIVAASDIVLASEDAVFGLPEVGIGLAPMVVMEPLAQTMSAKSLSLMALTGERLSATQALAAGLVTKVLPKSEVSTQAITICTTITKQGPNAVRATKLALRQISHHTDIHELADRSALLSIGNEASEGMTAFREKRSPSWKL